MRRLIRIVANIGFDSFDTIYRRACGLFTSVRTTYA